MGHVDGFFLLLILLLPEAESPSPGSAAPPTAQHVSDLLSRLESLKTNQKAVEEFSRLGPAAIPHLIPMLKDPSQPRRANAAWLIFVLGRENQPDRAALEGALRDTEQNVRTWAGIAPAWSGSREPILIPELVQGLAEWPRLQTYSAKALGAMKADARTALPALERVLADVSSTPPAPYADQDLVIPAVIQAIQDIGGDPLAATKTLRNVVTDAEPERRMVAIHRLGLLRARAALPTLEATLREVNPRIRLSTLTTLAQFGPSAVGALDSIVPLLRDSDMSVRIAADHAVGAMGPAAKKAAPEPIHAISHQP